MAKLYVWLGPVIVIIVLAFTSGRAAADTPHVMELHPANGAVNVDCDTAELRIVFDTDMETGGFSICGGGATFPKIVGRLRWVDARTLVASVKLKPNHEYKMSVNCASANNFRSADGTPVEPVPWTFKTGAKRAPRGEDTDGATDAKTNTAPKVIKLFPENGAMDVDPKITELRVEFDQDMDTRGFSFCGGGPAFPKPGDGRTEWVDARTIVMRVKLEPDHEYQMWLNCPSAQNFRSADGSAIESVPWSFSTAAAKAKKLSKKKQKKLNARSLKELMVALRDHYSYYDLRVKDWEALEKKHHKKIVSSKNTRIWVKRVAKMLSDAKDVHLWLTYRDKTTNTFSRKITRNCEFDGIKATLPGLIKRNACVYTAQTDDDIAYIMITTLSRNRTEQLENVQNILKEYLGSKALILDLRPNGGGAEPLAMPIAATFVKGTKIYAKHIMRNPDAKGGFTEPYERKITGKPRSKRFRGPVAVLSGPGIMSSCEAFLLMMKQGEDVAVIGAPSYGSSGNPHPHKLANGVEVFIPSWKAMRPDGTCFEGEGIAPDIEVKAEPSEFKKGDPVIERALKYLREKTD